MQAEAPSADSATVALRQASWVGNAELFALEGSPPQAATRAKIVRALASRGRHLSWRVTLDNPTDASLRLTVGVRVTGRFAGPLTFWDGLGERPAGAEREANSNIRGTFPMSCLVSGETGIAAGLAPREIVSWFEHSYMPAADGPQLDASLRGESLRLACAVRVALAPGETLTREFVLYGFQAPFGYRDALQVYYDEFPSVFHPLPDVDPRVNLNGATYHAWTSNDPEMCRRMRAGWEWCYAPFRRTGDWYGRADRWDYQPVRAMSKDRAMPREAYLAA
ncbi:MAG: hypothetical protein FJ279_32170, partial [Planctomycetes bacterium]|nr:hypothetical protein [Planctomycetota bacterium]